jgi:hypothetical protein
MKTTSMMAVALAFLCVSTVAFAKGHKSGTGTAPAHHCQLNGAEAHKSKKDCLKAGGTWEKGAPGHAAAAAPKTPPPAAQ